MPTTAYTEAQLAAARAAGNGLRAIRHLRQTTGCGLFEAATALGYNVNVTTPTRMTRAQKETAVVVMAQRLEQATRDFSVELGFTLADGKPTDALERAVNARNRRRAALVRLAMAATADDGQ